MQNNKKNAIFFYSEKQPNFTGTVINGIFNNPPIFYQDEVYVPACSMIPKNVMPNRYIVSNYGKVWDMFENQFVKEFYDRGYTRINLQCYDELTGRYTSKITNMHRVVLAAFNYFPGCEKLEVNHKDTTLYNGLLCNWLCKLEWCTRKENMKYAVSLGHMVQPKGGDSPNASITNRQASNVCKLFEQGKSTQEVKEITGINSSVLNQIKAGNTYTNVSKKYTLPKLRQTIDESTVIEICNEINRGKSNREISSKLQVTEDIVSNIRCGKTWTDITKGRIKYSETGRSIIDRNTVIAICNEINNGKTNVAIAAEFGVSTDIVSDIRCGNTWTDITAGRIEYSKFYKTNSEIHEVCRLLEEGKSLTQIMKISGMSKGTIIGIKKGRIHKEISSQYDIPVYTQVNTPEEVVHEICKRLEQKEAQCDIAKDLIKRGKITNKNIVNDISRGHKFKNISCQYKI